MQIFVNRQAVEVADAATLADALAQVNAKPPFAAAVNLQFVPKQRYEMTLLKAGDQVEVIAPITGG
jgi:sulfur carrier protein